MGGNDGSGDNWRGEERKGKFLYLQKFIMENNNN